MPTKVIQWGAGYAGAYGLRYLINNPAYEVVGVKCFTAAKGGRAWYLELLPILASGKNVISPICSATHYRLLADPEGFLDGLNQVCRTGNSTVAFFGLDPGFLTDALPLTMAGAVGEVTQIRTYEILLYADYTEAETLAMPGFGARQQDLPPEGIDSLGVSWGGVPHLIADATRVQIDDITVDIDVALAPETFTSPGGAQIGEGTIAGIKFSVSGIAGGSPVIVVNHVTRMREDIGPEWPNVGTLGGYRIEIDSFPTFVGEFPLGLPGGTGSSFADAMSMTAARCVNAIDAVVTASPGHKTFLDLAPWSVKTPSRPRPSRSRHPTSTCTQPTTRSERPHHEPNGHRCFQKV